MTLSTPITRAAAAGAQVTAADPVDIGASLGNVGNPEDIVAQLDSGPVSDTILSARV
ncbi:MAG: hypothetical protein WBF71_02345 [Microthrixaceae bacterium]